jgi:methylmalonyl-CoA/ethylmalonyl-CoA epimerase
MLTSFKFHHIGIATTNIKNTAKYYLDAEYIISDTIFDPIQNVSIAFLEKNGMPRIELLEPVLSSNSPINKIIEKSGVSPYHICYEVDDIETAIKELKKKKYLPLSRPVNAIAINNKKICFLFNKDIGLIELVENRI